MNHKQQILLEIQESLRSGVLTEADLRAFITSSPEPVAVKHQDQNNATEKLSAVDVMFYVAGIVFFSTIMSVIAQSWNSGDAVVHIALSAGLGSLLWSIVYYLSNSPFQNEIRTGLTNALLLTGSLLLVVGAYIITNELIGGYGEINFIPGAIALAILGTVHFGFDRLIRKDLTLLMGVFMGVAAFPALLFGILQDADVPMDVWSIVFITSFGLLAYATRVMSKIYPDRLKIRNAFDSLATFSILMTMFVANFGDYGVLWLGVLIVSVFGIFYLSIISQNKHLLGNASFFLVITVITASFKYFSGLGATMNLIIATLGLLGSAAIASSINKKYFKTSS